MSHLILRLGDLLHFHPFAHELADPQPLSAGNDVVGSGTIERRSTNPPDDLAFFSLSVEHEASDPRTALDRLGMIGLGGEDLPEID